MNSVDMFGAHDKGQIAQNKQNSNANTSNMQNADFNSAIRNVAALNNVNCFTRDDNSIIPVSEKTPYNTSRDRMFRELEKKLISFKFHNKVILNSFLVIY